MSLNKEYVFNDIDFDNLDSDTQINTNNNRNFDNQEDLGFGEVKIVGTTKKVLNQEEINQHDFDEVNAILKEHNKEHNYDVDFDKAKETLGALGENTDDLLVNQYITSKKAFLEKKTEEFIKALLHFDQEKKEIERQIKITKEIFKQDGVDINKVSKVFNRVKTRLRAKESDLNEEDLIEEKILNDDDIVNEIKDVISPIVIDLDDIGQ